MTANDFRKLALGFPETEERAHMNHPDFRVAGKIFATLGYPDKSWGMVKLTPVEQEMFVEAEPAVFVPAKGAWGHQGSTTVNLKAAKLATMRRALAAAWQLAAPKNLVQGIPAKTVAASSEAPKERAERGSRKKSRGSSKSRERGRKKG